MIIDTMIFAYALLGVTKYREEAVAVLNGATEILIPDSLRAELVNVVWQWVKTRDIPVETGIEVLRDADTLTTQAVSSSLLWERALYLSLQANHSAYDTIFIALAESAKTKVVTFDIKLRKNFPDQTVSPTEFLSRKTSE